MNLGKYDGLLLGAGQAGNIDPEEFGGCSDGVNALPFRSTLDDFGAALETGSVGQEHGRNDKGDEAETSPNILNCIPHVGALGKNR
jgi:hypothetical protein